MGGFFYWDWCSRAVASLLFVRNQRAFPRRGRCSSLSVESGTRPQRVSLFERWVPTWFWWLRDILRNPRAAIRINGAVIDCKGLSEQVLADLLPETAQAETNGLRGWILRDETLARLRQQIEATGVGQVISRPCMQIGHGVRASMFIGGTHPAAGGPQVGLVLDVLPLVRNDGTDLTAILTMTEAVTNRSSGTSLTNGVAEPTEAGGVSVVTNLAAAARLKLPKGTGAFILTRASSNDARCLGVLLSVAVKR